MSRYGLPMGRVGRYFDLPAQAHLRLMCTSAFAYLYI